MSKKNFIVKRILICGIAAALAVSVSGCSLFQGDESSDAKQNSSESNTSETTQAAGASKFGNDIAVKSKSYNITLPIMTYLFNYNYKSYVDNYGTYMTYYGFDSTKDLKEQYYNEESGQTWYDYFMDMTKQYIEQTLIMAEAAKENGVELDESDNKTIEETITSLQSAASANSQTAEQYISSYYGSGVTESDIRECLKLTTLAQKYYNQLHDGYKYTDEDYEKFYEENKTSYLYADFLSFSFDFTAETVSGEESAEVSVNAEEKQKAKSYAEDLAKCKTAEEFKDYITKYLKANPDLVHTESSAASDESSAETSVSEKELDAAIQTQVDAALTSKYTYEVTSEAGKWVFEDGRKQNETKIIEGTDNYTVIMMVKPAYRDESINKNVRHILLSTETYGTEDKAKAKADEVYAEWKKGDKTEDSFAKLAEKYSSDPGSSNNGGLYENVSEGQMVTEFNDWVFDKSRKKGDTGIVKTSYGYHIMYFSGDSDAAWKVSVDSAMRTQDYQKDYEALQKKFTIEFDDDYLKNIDVFVSSSSEAAESTAQSAAGTSTESKAQSAAESSAESKSKS